MKTWKVTACNSCRDKKTVCATDNESAMCCALDGVVHFPARLVAEKDWRKIVAVIKAARYSDIAVTDTLIKAVNNLDKKGKT